MFRSMHNFNSIYLCYHIIEIAENLKLVYFYMNIVKLIEGE